MTRPGDPLIRNSIANTIIARSSQLRNDLIDACTIAADALSSEADDMSPTDRETMPEAYELLTSRAIRLIAFRDALEGRGLEQHSVKV